MVRVCSMFSQILGWFPRLEFDAAVREHKAERHARDSHAGSSSWRCCSPVRPRAEPARDLWRFSGDGGQTASSGDFEMP
jgi:hypothetical protein